jgi:DNA topoisomerase-2
MGGKDFASTRYIFTQLNKITRYIFREEDDPILTYVEDDG